MTAWPALNLYVDLAAWASHTNPADPSAGGNWSDIAAFIRTGSMRRGMSRYDGPVIRYQAGTSTFQLTNTDARFDPTNLSGPYVSGGVSQVKPARHIALQAVWNSVRYYLWRGFAESWQPEYPMSGNDATVTLTGSDGMADMGRRDLGSSAHTTTYQTNVRTGGALANWALYAPADLVLADTNIQTKGRPVQDFPATLSGNVLAGAQLAADTELGELYIDPQGRLVFRLYGAIFSDTRSNTSQATFQPGTSLPFESVALSYDANSLKNSVQIGRAGGTAQWLEDLSGGVLEYHRHFFGRTDLLHQTDAESVDLAKYLLTLLSLPELRIDSITIDPQAAPATLFPQVLSRELGDRITVVFTPPGGSAITRPCFIRGISHAWTEASWKTTWALQDATRFDQFLIFDDATRGKLDTGRMGY